MPPRELGSSRSRESLVGSAGPTGVGDALGPGTGVAAMAGARVALADGFAVAIAVGELDSGVGAGVSVGLDAAATSTRAGRQHTTGFVVPGRIGCVAPPAPSGGSACARATSLRPIACSSNPNRAADSTITIVGMPCSASAPAARRGPSRGAATAGRFNWEQEGTEDSRITGRAPRSALVSDWFARALVGPGALYQTQKGRNKDCVALRPDRYPRSRL